MSGPEKQEFPMPLADGLTVVGNYHFNLYLVQGEQAFALIETGVSAVVDQVVDQLKGLRVSPTFLVVTHPHTDHITGLPGLKEAFPDALVVAGEGAAEFLAHPKAEPALIAEDYHISKWLERKGLKPGRPPLTSAPTLAESMVARDGDHMDLGGKTLEFLSIKGHSPGKIVVHIPEIKALMVSDSMGFRYPARGVLPLFLTGYHEHMKALERLENLAPQIAGVAHHGPLQGREQVREGFAQVRSEAEKLKMEILRDDRPADHIASDLFDRYYTGDCTMYTEENIRNCCKLLVKRVKQLEDQ
jgi:glyoxylase-like metal-dependent hydrolase (beta-lactamase superfamily II)